MTDSGARGTRGNAIARMRAIEARPEPSTVREAMERLRDTVEAGLDLVDDPAARASFVSGLAHLRAEVGPGEMYATNALQLARFERGIHGAPAGIEPPPGWRWSTVHEEFGRHDFVGDGPACLWAVTPPASGIVAKGVLCGRIRQWAGHGRTSRTEAPAPAYLGNPHDHPIWQEVADAIADAMIRHAPMHSPHEGWSVVLEELEELREHVRADTGRSAEARREAIQVAAMGLRYALDLFPER